MRLESALYSSRSGLDTHGQAISVVGDNIANVNTTGFKTSRVQFSDLYAEGGEGRQSIAGPTTGNGVSLKSVQQLHETGVAEPTGRPLDAAIAGAGFFVVGDAKGPEFTRAGNFQLADSGELQTGDGKPVLGYQGTATALSPLNLFNTGTTGAPTTASALYGNVSSDSAITAPPTNPQGFSDIANVAASVMTMSVYDSLGASHVVNVALFKTGVNQFTARAYVDGGEVGGTAGVPTQVGGDAQLKFGNDGVIGAADQAGASITANPAYGNGAAAGNFTIDLSKFTQYAAPSQLMSVEQNGKGSGQIKSYEISKNGDLFALLDSGDRSFIGSLVLATFPNESGLDRSGSGTFITSDNSGSPVIQKAGSGSSGTIEGSALERSTVDISSQFIDLILYQRGYQANSQTLSATNDLLRDTIQLIR